MVAHHGVAHGAALGGFRAFLGSVQGRSDRTPGRSRLAAPAPAPSSRRPTRTSRATFVSRGCTKRSTLHTPVAGVVTFAPGARTAWHSHPGGQILIVTAGTGRVQLWGQPIEEIRAGDVVSIPPGVKHWHGASPNASMTHLGITEQRDGTAVQWMEKVSDEQYQRRVAAPDMPQGSPQPTQSGSRLQPPIVGRAPQPSGELQQRIAPGLATLTDDVLFGDVWTRPELSPRDRSLVTISVLIATGKTAQLAGHLGRALTNGVKPSEASALLAHLAIYCGWPSAVSALEVYEQVYNARKVDTSSLRAVSPPASGCPPRTAAAEALTLNWEPSRRSSCS